MRHSAPPIVKLAERLMGELERAVSGFPRRWKYSVGAKLCKLSFKVAYCANLAWSDKYAQDQRIAELSQAIDRLKLCMQLAQQLQAFASFAQFEMLAGVTSDLGRQCGGWQKKRTSMRQNGQEPAPGQRPQILSSHAASSEASL